MWESKRLLREERDQFRSDLVVEVSIRQGWAAKAAILEKQLAELGKQLNTASNCYQLYSYIGQNHARIWTLENQIIQRDKEIALLKYRATNPTFGSTHTPVVQEKKGKRK